MYIHPISMAVPLKDGKTKRSENVFPRETGNNMIHMSWRDVWTLEILYMEDPIRPPEALQATPDDPHVPVDGIQDIPGLVSSERGSASTRNAKVFPDVLLSNAYIILRPFFRPLVAADSEEFLDAKNWEFDLSSPEFHGLVPRDGGMTSVPKANPGDAVFWHCDVIHAVEEEHIGTGDAAVMYIPAVPFTRQNQEYVEKKRDLFLEGRRPPDFPQGKCEFGFVGIGKADDILAPLGRKAMGVSVAVA